MRESMRDNVEILYHYCSVETFRNIVQNAVLWLSDIEKSNDKQEGMICRDWVNQDIKGYLENDDKSLQIWEKWYKNGVGIEKRSPIKMFCACFSEGRDDLGQWREYAQNGKGIAIGFDKKILEELNLINEYYISFGKVIYKNSKRYIQKLVNENIRKLKYKGVGHVALELAGNYKIPFSFVKAPCFSQEREWRVVVRAAIGNYNIPGSNKISFSKVKYRVSDDKLIPYIEMNFERIKQKVIKEILLGPKSKVEIWDIIHFLDFYGYYKNVEDGYDSTYPIRVERSSSSYR